MRIVIVILGALGLGLSQPAQVGPPRQQPGQLASPSALPKTFTAPQSRILPTTPDPAAPADASDEKPLFSVGTKLVLAPVITTDKSGRLVNGLSPLDFQLFDNGIPQTISEDVATHPISLVVAIQASAETEQLLPGVRKIGNLVANMLAGKNGEVALIKYDHRIQTLTGFTTELDQIEAGLKKLKPGSSSSRLNDATMQGLNMLRNRPANRKRILLIIGASRDIGSEIRVREVLTEAEFSNVVIYSVDMSHLLAAMSSKAEPPRPNPIPPEARPLPGGYVGTPTTESQMNMGNWVPGFQEIFIATKAIFIPNPLEVYTRYTGGKEYSYKTQRGLEHSLSEIGEELHGQYLLTYPVGQDFEGGFHEIEVRVLKPELKVRTRTGYWLAGPAKESPKKR